MSSVSAEGTTQADRNWRLLPDPPAPPPDYLDGTLLCVGLLAACGGDDWTTREIRLVEVEGKRLIVAMHCHEDARATAEETSSHIRGASTRASRRVASLVWTALR